LVYWIFDELFGGKYNFKKSNLKELSKLIIGFIIAICGIILSSAVSIPDHTHTIDKIDAVLSGRFKMGMLGQDVILEAGDCLTVPKGTVHNAEVVGNQPVISLDATK